MEDAVAALQVAATQSAQGAERDELTAAWHGLQENKAKWSAQYPTALLAIFNANATATAQATWAPAAAAEPARPAASAFLSHDTFSLVNDADVSQAIASSRLLQQLLPMVESILAELNTLISTVQGFPTVKPELNPLRPEAFVQTLREMISATTAEPGIAALWLRYLADPLGRELHRVYERVVNLLELADVQGASYRVLQSPVSAANGRAMRNDASKGSGSGSGSGVGVGQRDSHTGGYVSDEPMARPPSQYADLSNDETRDDLFQDFLVHDGRRDHHGLAPAYYVTIEEELLALKAASDSALAPLAGSPEAPRPDDQRVPTVDRTQHPVDERSRLNSQVWGTYGRPKERAIVRTQLKKEAQRVGQALGLEVVRKLVNQMGQDPRLLVPVREAMVALEPSLLRLVMVDPHFFSNENHPARCLMARATQRSFKYNDESSPEFLAFFGPLTRVFNELNHLVIADAQPFAKALATLAAGWDAQDQRETENRIHVLHALRFAEERQTQADQIAIELSQRSDLENVPDLVLEFLLGPWALVMSHARLTDTRNQIDPQGFGSVVPDLLWSVKRDVTLKQPTKLIEMLPGLLDKLHAGLALIGKDPHESETFFDSLMTLHQPALRLRRLKSQHEAENSGAMPLTPARHPPALAPPWLGRDDLDAAGFEDTLPTAPGELMPLAEENEDGMPVATPVPGTVTARHATPMAAPAPEPAASSAAVSAMTRSDAEQLLLGLQVGHWVDLYSKHRWLRAQLVWASSEGTLFMFVSHGGQPHSMTKRSCERLIRERLLRPVETHDVVAQALDRLIKEARSG